MDQELLNFILIGFLAQLVDGALGMAYGITSTTFLLSAGLPAAPASASVHAAEVFTTGVSGLSHFRLGNVDRGLMARLVIPGISGGVLGAYILTTAPDDLIRPVVAIYMVVMGGIIVWKAFAKLERTEVRTKLIPLGFAGGFLDAIGGGGWGPVVTSTLMARGNNPRLTVGSVNAAEFFVTTSQAAAFVAMLGMLHWKIIAGLIIGGVAAAPLGAHLCQKLPPRVLMTFVGLLIIGLSLRTLSQSL